MPDLVVAAPNMVLVRAKKVGFVTVVVVKDGEGEHVITVTMRFGTSLAEPE